MSDNKVEIIITAKNLATAALKQTARLVTKTVGGAVKGLMRQLTSLKTLALGAFAGWGLKRLAEDFIKTGSTMDQLKMRLDTITKGKGEEWFEKLNQWALKMPVNTAKAVDSFAMMRAMGLQPTIKDMTTLVDTSSALGGDAGTLQGIARALGQIQTKGKVSAEELMQLAERGVPAYEMLKQKFKLTSEQVGNIAKQGLNANKAVQALLSGMAERFGGQSEKIQKKWVGLTETLRSYWKEFQRLVMESGVMAFLEEKLAGIVAKLDTMVKSGELKEWAEKTGKVITDMMQKAYREVLKLVNKIFELYKSGELTEWAKKAKNAFDFLWRAIKKAIEILDTFATKWDSFWESPVVKYGATNYISPEGRIYPIVDMLEFDNDLATPKGIEDFFNEGIEIPFKATLESSPKLPFSTGIEKIREKISSLHQYVSNLDTGYNINATGLTSALENVSSSYSGKISNMISYLAERQIELSDVSRGHKPYQFTTYRNIIQGQIQEGMATLQSTFRQMQAEQALTAKYYGGNATTNLGGITINASGGDDWRSIVRNNIIPELRSAGVI